MPECFCGAFFDSEDSLRRHINASGCRVAYEEAMRATSSDLPSHARAAQQAQAEASERAKGGKRQRDDDYKKARLKSVTLALARMRYQKLVPCLHVDEFKDMHTVFNKLATEHATTQLTSILEKHVSQETMSAVTECVREAFDIYDGVRTEKAEMAYLKSDAIQLPSLKYSARHLSTGGHAYDFEIDDALLKLLKHCPEARTQVYNTLSEWRTDKPPTRDNPAKVIVDIPDGICFDVTDLPICCRDDRADPSDKSEVW